MTLAENLTEVSVDRRPGGPPFREAGLPAELRVSLARGVRVLGHGRVLVGGAPLRAVSLTSHGADVVRGWITASPVGQGANRGRLARRLIDAGMLSPHPPAGGTCGELTIVVPARDRPEQLARCLRALQHAAPGASVVVVDDGSSPRLSAPRLGHGDRVQVVRHAEPRGPAAARNSGVAACSTPFVGFVDSDVVLPEDAARRLLSHFVDPGVAAVAPRIRGLSDCGRVAGYESRHSALDMGRVGGLVAPGRPVAYVPSTVLFVRRAAIGAGFDESLWTGEDVDFVWRLHAHGWRVRYASEVAVLHEHPARLSRFIARRHLYARSVGELAVRHPGALAAVWITPSAALVWALAMAGMKRRAAAAALWAMIRTDRRLRAVVRTDRHLRALPVAVPGPGAALSVPGPGAALTLRGLGHAGLALGRAVRRTWSPPILIVAHRSPAVRRVISIAFAARLLQDAIATRDPVAAVLDAPMRLLDDLLAAAGTWQGCLQARTVRPLLPSFRPPHERRP